jgi:hypothetical protein
MITGRALATSRSPDPGQTITNGSIDRVGAVMSNVDATDMRVPIRRAPGE